MELFIGLFGGLLLSILFWVVLNHFIMANIQFSTEISKTKVDFYKSGLRCQFAIQNYGHRNALDVRVVASIGIKDILKNGGSLRSYHSIKVGRMDIFCLKPKIVSRKTIFVDESPAFSKSIFPQSIRDKYKAGILTLDDLFDEFPNSFLRIQILATDSVSSSTKYFVKTYRKRDITDGKFPRKSMVVVP